MGEHSIGQQVRRSAVALISLALAFTSLGYNPYCELLRSLNSQKDPTI